MRKMMARIGAAIVARGLASASLFLASVMAARMLGPQDFGSYSVILMFGGIYGSFLQRGLSPLILKRSPELVGPDTAGMRQLLQKIHKIYFSSIGVISLVCIIVLACSTFFWDRFHITTFNLFSTVAIGISLSLTQIYSSFHKASGKIELGIFLESAGRPIALLLFIVTFYFGFFGSPNITKIVFAYICSSLIVMFAAGLFIRNYHWFQSISKINLNLSEFKRESDRIFKFFAAEAILANSGLLICSMMLNANDAGLYKTSVALADMILLVALTITGPLTPGLATQIFEKNIAGAAKVIRATQCIGLFLCVLVVCVFYFEGDALISLIYGHKFLSQFPLLTILAIGSSAMALSSLPSWVIIFSGESKYAFKVSVTCVIITIGLGATLATKNGLLGVSGAVMSGLLLRALMLSYRAWKILR